MRLHHKAVHHLLFLIALCTILGIRVDAETPPAADVNRALPSTELQARVDSLAARIASAAGEGAYVVIDRTHNVLELRQGGRVLQRSACATGSGLVLLGDRQKSWMFETPRGLFRIQRKVTDPIWAKPEWAFVEVGEEAPVLPWMFNRLDQTTLGDYALELGDGYEIHGTLYPALLGRNITHGCVRLNDEDLEALHSATAVGTPVIIY